MHSLILILPLVLMLVSCNSGPMPAAPIPPTLSNPELSVPIPLTASTPLTLDNPVVTIPSTAPIPSTTSTNSDEKQLPTHTVVKNDTLYSIAVQYGLDYLELAKINQIKAPYRIYTGQVIALSLQTQKPKVTANNLPKQAIEPVPALEDPPGKDNQTKIPGKINWVWPMTGLVQAKFGTGTPKNKGIDILGSGKASVVAAAAGEVIYVDSDIRSANNLIILRHDRHRLSAYKSQQKVAIEENQKVTQGQILTQAQSDRSQENHLHFEIRRDGQAVDPLRYLPEIPER